MKSTKKALFTSMLSLVLCVAMLIGTTFAWFTDSVKSGVNTIKAGNLDVELEYSKDMTTWNTVTDATKIFDDEALWEPGRTEVVYLRISNKGTLALKYDLRVMKTSETPGVSQKNNSTIKLSDYIEYGTAEVTEAYATREAAVTAVTTAPLVSHKISEAFTKSGTMLKGAQAQVVAMVVYMPTTVENEANYKAGSAVPTIKMGIALTATQFNSEVDSFNENYDKNLDTPPDGLEVSGDDVVPLEDIVYDDANHLAIINNADGYRKYMTEGKTNYKVKLGADIDFGGEQITTITLTELDGNGHTLKNAKADRYLFTGYNEGILGTVQNLTLDNIVITGSGKDSGIFGSDTVTRAGTFSNVVVTNCKIEGTAEYAGVFVGNVAFSTFTNCRAVNCEVTAQKNAGVLIGMAQTYGDDTTLTNCSAEGGSVSITKTGRQSIGLLVGRAITPEGGVINLTGCSASGTALDNAGTAVAAPTLVGDTAGYSSVYIDGVEYVQ